jgi:hypothetical protein
MNRIYQGRVSRADLIDEKGNATPLADWEQRLWEHHALFQDAVNYYLVCLLALADGGTEETQRIVELRERITREPGTENPADTHFFVWGKFRRRGVWRRGLRESVAKYLTPGNDAPTFEECRAAALAGNPHADAEEGCALLDRGLWQVLDYCEKKNVQQCAPEFFPRLCNPKFCGTFQEDSTRRVRDAQRPRFLRVLHAATTRHDSAVLDAFGPESIALLKGRDMPPAKAKEKLRTMIGDWRKEAPEAEEDWARLEAKIEALPPTTTLPDYAGTSAKGAERLLLYAMFFFRLLEKSDFTFGLMRRVSRAPVAAAKDIAPEGAVATAGDPIRTTRGERGYVFRAFTSFARWGGGASGLPQWLPFDVAAFEEALKSLHQVETKGEERRKECEKKQARHALQRDPKAKWKAGAVGEEGERPPLLVGDPRIARLTALVDEEMKAEYEMSEGVEVKYGLHPRTTRGFREIRKIWNDALGPSDSFTEERREKLWRKLTDYKVENAESIGSPVLIDKLVEEENWIIWRDPTPEQMSEWRRAAKLPGDAEFARDPLQALTDERELLADIERLQLPVRLTPADPEHSRRQFYFSDVSDLTKKGRLRHNQRWLTAEVAVERNGKLAPAWVRIEFTAPRLMRDQLTTVGDAASAWQQAMMQALGLRMALTKDGKPADFAACTAVALMPEVAASGEKRILLNFPVTLEAESIAARIGKAARWDALQFGGADGESYWLRWPGTWIDEKKERKKAPPAPWWKSAEPWRCLSVDLGQRDAGAFAVIEATRGDAPKKQSRKLGVAEGATWWATVRAMGLLRLPGEDAKVFREGKWQEELSGERGRNCVPGEWEEACGVCERLGFDPDKLLGTERARRSFPELNGELLYALRRAQARLARLQSWSCVAHEESDEKKRAAFENRCTRIKEQIAEALVTRAAEEMKNANDRGQELVERSAWLVEAKSFVGKGAWDCVRDILVREITKERAIIQRELVLIAGRIQPLRGRGWEWVPRPDDAQNFFLRQTGRGSDDRKKLLAGQRGLSIERIEQLESLRQRCQSLNRALRQEPGKPAGLGRGKRGIELPDPCPELLDRLEALKEQRVNQTAHLILAQALGVRLKAHTSAASERAARDIHGEYERIPGREPVDFLVLENLDRYLASQGRSRGENSRLMKWCHRQILGKLKQLCEPYGLRVLETPAAYSSQFCSRTGGAGFRAMELTPDSAREHRWQKHIVRLREEAEGKRKLDKPDREESQRVKEVVDALTKLNEDLLVERDIARAEGRTFRPKWRTLLVPVAGGPIFIPMQGQPMQADINAAINLGLRAIAAPEAGDIHVRIRAKRDGDTFFVRAENAREKARWPGKPPEIAVPDEADRKKLLADAHLNFFSDVAKVADFDLATIDGTNGFASGRGIFGTIRGNDWRVGKDWLRCQELNRARIHCAEHAGDNIPM